MTRTIGFLRLMRPANIITAIADILLGFAASGAFLLIVTNSTSKQGSLLLPDLGWLILSTIGLYGGGVVLNDVFDAELDRIERPERPIPSGLISLKEASILGGLLLLTGVAAAFMVNIYSTIVAISIALLVLLYDSFSKHYTFLAPLNMGLCRGGNVLLGISIIPAALYDLWFLSIIPIIYIGAITMISQGEVHGGNRNSLKAALALYALVILFILSLGILAQYNVWNTIPFLLLFTYLIFPPLLKAHKVPEPNYIRKAVKSGILSLIIMDASIASGFAGWNIGILIVMLLPLSIYIGKKFAVT